MEGLRQRGLFDHLRFLLDTSSVAGPSPELTCRKGGISHVGSGVAVCSTAVNDSRIYLGYMADSRCGAVPMKNGVSCVDRDCETGI